MDIQYTEIGCVCRYLVANWLAQQLVSKSWKAQVMSVSYVHDRGYLCDKNSVSNIKTMGVTPTLVSGPQINWTHNILLTVMVVLL